MWVFVICFQSNYMCSCSVYSQQRNKLLLAKLLNKHKLFYAKKGYWRDFHPSEKVKDF